MSKKFIALVLFAAMLVSMIPVASAQTNYVGVDPEVGIYNDYWYVGQNVEKLDKTSTAIDAPEKADKVIGKRVLNGEETDGITVYIGENEKNTADDYVRTIEVEGSYAELQPYYYTYMAQYGTMGVALKIPVAIKLGNEWVSQQATISGNIGWSNTYPGNVTNLAYITVPLTQADGEYTYSVWFQSSDVATIKVKWNNTDDDVTKAKDTAVPTLTVVGVAGAQKENFRADFTQAAWKKDGDWYYHPGVLKFDIAAMNEDDRVSILEAGNNTMTVKVKALDKNGYTYPQGTMVTFQKTFVNDQDTFLGSSDKFVTVDGVASYLIDNTGCFTMTFSGIQNFAWIAGTSDWKAAEWSMGTIKEDTIKGYKAQDQGNVYLYTLINGTLRTNNTANANTSRVSAVKNSPYVIRFAYGNTFEELGFSLKYQNVDRSYSGITLLTDVVTVKVGEQVGVPYIIDNPMAMYQGIDGEWTIVNKNIADFGKDTNGDTDQAVIKGVKVGTTYAYCKDFAKDIELVVINVVPADYVEAPVVEPEVEVGTKYVVTASKLNVREGAGTSYSRIRQIDRNTVVTGTEVEGSGKPHGKA